MILETFNEYFNTLPALKSQVYTAVENAEGWDERAQVDALRILSKPLHLKVETYPLHGKRITKLSIEIKVSFNYEECSITPQDSVALKEYVENLCGGINNLSPILKYSYSNRTLFDDSAEVWIEVTF